MNSAKTMALLMFLLLTISVGLKIWTYEPERPFDRLIREGWKIERTE